MNPKCGWCKKADPLVDVLNEDGYKIAALDLNDPEDAKRAKEVQQKYDIKCGTPLFIDAKTGNSICGYRDLDVLEKWANGEKIPAPPARPAPTQNQNAQQQMSQIIDLHKFRLDIWQEAKNSLSENFYNDLNIWKEWKFNDMKDDCPVKELPVYPTTDQVREEARKIYEFIQKGS